MEETRIERLLRKAEEAIDQHNTEEAEAYRLLADLTHYINRHTDKTMRRAAKNLAADLATLGDSPAPSHASPHHV